MEIVKDILAVIGALSLGATLLVIWMIIKAEVKD